MNEILLTGASGFIGSHLLDYLIDTVKIPERSLHLIVRNPKKLHRSGKFVIHIGDLRDTAFVKQTLKHSFDTIFHLAAVSGFGGTTLKDYREGNVLFMDNLLAAINPKHIQKFIFFSTIAVYGLPSGVGDILNWDETHPHTFSEMYGQAKEEAEQKLKEYASRHHLPYSIIRPSSVYGPRDSGQLFGLIKAIDKGYFFIIGNGKNKMDFVFVKDLIRGSYQAALSTKKQSEYILGSGNPVSLTNITDLIAKELGKESRFLHVPTSFALPLSYATQFIGNITHLPVPLFPSRVKILTSTYYFSIKKAQKDLSYAPTISVQEGIQKTIEWYKNQQS